MSSYVRTVVGAIVLTIALFSSSVAEDGSTVPDKIERLLENGKFEDARVELLKFRKEAPDNPQAIFYLARLERDSRKADALFMEVEILADTTLAAKAALERAGLQLVGDSLPEAENLYRKIIEKYPTSSSCGMAGYRLGTLALVGGRIDEARKCFEASLETGGDNVLNACARAGIMECHFAKGEWTAVIESSRDVLEADADDVMTPRVLEAVARSWRELGNTDNANHYTERLLKHFPGSIQAHSVRVRAGGPLASAGESVTAARTEMSNSPGSTVTGEGIAATGSSAEVTADNARFTVQASAFAEKNNALKLYRRLKDAKFNSHMSLKTVAKSHFYLVQVGYFMTREEAEKTAEKVTGFTGIKAHIITLR